MIYQIKPGIAAYCEIPMEGRRPISVVFLKFDAGRRPVVHFSTEVPDKVRSAVEQHFTNVFSLKVGERERYNRKVGEIVIHVN